MDGIWEFKEYSTKDLNSISDHCYALAKLGVDLDENMLAELSVELRKREREK
jgi:hypothetical protein